MLNSNVIICAIILTVSFHKIASVSGFSPRKTAADYGKFRTSFYDPKIMIILLIYDQKIIITGNLWSKYPVNPEI